MQHWRYVAMKNDNVIIRRLRERGLPVTKENYLKENRRGSDITGPYDAEEMAQVPDFLDEDDIIIQRLLEQGKPITKNNYLVENRRGTDITGPYNTEELAKVPDFLDEEED
jgi:hypothetical protein